MKICDLKEEDFPAASELIWKTYYACEKDRCTMDELAAFRDLIAPMSLRWNAIDGSIRYCGAFEDGALVAVGAVRDEKHVLLLYVRHDLFGRGYGTAMLKHLIALCRGGTVTVNSSDHAVGFYRRFGFEPVGERRREDGIAVTPMRLTKS